MVTILLKLFYTLFLFSKLPIFKEAASPALLDILVKETLCVS